MLWSSWYGLATAWDVFGGWMDCTQAVPAEREVWEPGDMHESPLPDSQSSRAEVLGQ